MSHLTSPNQKPLVNSFFEIADNPAATLTIDKGYGLDLIIQVLRTNYAGNNLP